MPSITQHLQCNAMVAIQCNACNTIQFNILQCTITSKCAHAMHHSALTVHCLQYMGRTHTQYLHVFTAQCAHATHQSALTVQCTFCNAILAIQSGSINYNVTALHGTYCTISPCVHKLRITQHCTTSLQPMILPF